jgi:hypothetical protein
MPTRGGAFVSFLLNRFAAIDGAGSSGFPVYEDLERGAAISSGGLWRVDLLRST